MDSSRTQSTLHPNAAQEPRLSRSPHPYHRRGTSLIESQVEKVNHPQPKDQSTGPSTFNSSSESGTEADDERGRFLKSLPAPPLRPHKGLRDAPFEDPTSQPSPLDTPSAVEDNDKQLSLHAAGKMGTWSVVRGSEIHTIREKYTKRKRSEVVRRITETALFFTVGLIVSYHHLSKGRLLASIPGKTGFALT